MAVEKMPNSNPFVSRKVVINDDPSYKCNYMQMMYMYIRMYAVYRASTMYVSMQSCTYIHVHGLKNR